MATLRSKTSGPKVIGSAKLTSTSSASSVPESYGTGGSENINRWLNTTLTYGKPAITFKPAIFGPLSLPAASSFSEIVSYTS